MVAQIKTITSVTEQGMQRITRAINRGASSDDLTREIDRVVAAIDGSVGRAQAALQGAITAASADVTGQILAGLQLPQITPGVWRQIVVCMRALNQIEALVVAESFTRQTKNQEIADLKTKPEFQHCSTTLKDNLLSAFTTVFDEFGSGSLEEQRRKRLADITQLRLDIIHYYATQTQTESK
jgi:hypothetical protein